MKFGPAYFELAALVGITPAQHRSTEPCIRENAIHIGNEVIALIPANSAAIAAAISQLLPAPRPGAHVAVRNLAARLTRLEGQVRAAAGQYERLLNSRISAHREPVVESLRSMHILPGRLISGGAWSPLVMCRIHDQAPGTNTLVGAIVL